MIEYLAKIKNTLIRKISLVILFYILLIAFLFLTAGLRFLSTEEILLFVSLFILMSVIFFFLLRTVISKCLIDNFSNQENISRSLFKNTRNVINNISHELRTPLNAILGFSVNLYETEKNDERKKELLAIKENSERLFSMAKKLIDFSTLETGQYVLEKVYVKNELILSNLENKFAGITKDKGLAFEVNNTLPEDFEFFSDYNALFEIIEMLVENAIKFTEEGLISVNSYYEEGILNYIICDTGPGVPEDKKKLVFQLYQQGNSNLDREYEGLGLGLTIAEKLTQMLGGTIVLVDNGNKGSCFHIKFKIEPGKSKKEQNKKRIDFIPNHLSSEEMKSLRIAADNLSSCITVFNPAKIKLIAEEMVMENKKYSILSDRIINIADTFNEMEFRLIVEEIRKAASDEK